MANVNCLEGLLCPACKVAAPIYIEVTMFVLMHDDGDDSHDGDIAWDDESQASCWMCKHAGTVKDFRVDAE